MNSNQPLRQARLLAKPSLPKVLTNLAILNATHGETTTSLGSPGKLQERFPHCFGQPQVDLIAGEKTTTPQPLAVGVVLSGGQAPGGHNVIAGLYDALQSLHAKSTLIGFLNGPSGIVENRYLKITDSLLQSYRNLGGFDIIGSGRTKIETEDQLAASLQTAQKNQLDGLVVIGGDDSNTNAAVLAEYFLTHGFKTRVIGVPKTIDGDLKNEQIEISFGHDTACKVYAELIGNLMRDAMSARKYYHFIRLMGRSASHITLECALQTHPNWTLIGEEVAKQRWTLSQIASQLADVVERRAAKKKNYGVVVIPEGLIEFIPEVGQLIAELNSLLAKGVVDVRPQLTKDARHCFDSLPSSIQEQLLVDRDPHGNVQVSRIETEKLLIEMVKNKLNHRQSQAKFNAIAHFFGYEGRSAFPSVFDCNYCYALGHTAAVLIRSGLTGYMSSVRHLASNPEEWKAGGTPLTMMMNIEERHGKDKPVIRKALVDLQGAPFAEFARQRDSWVDEDLYGYPGPIQFYGPTEISQPIPVTLALEAQSLV